MLDPGQSGLWQVGSPGKYGVPHAEHRDPKTLAPPSLVNNPATHGSVDWANVVSPSATTGCLDQFRHHFEGVADDAGPVVDPGRVDLQLAQFVGDRDGVTPRW